MIAALAVIALLPASPWPVLMVYIASPASVWSMKISRPVIVNTALAVVVVGALAGGYLAIANPFAASGTSSVSQLTSEVQQGAVTSSITASGAIAALSQVDASFAVSGTIATVDTTLGATVTAGQVIGTLDAADLKKALTKANTSYSNAASSLSDAQQALSLSLIHI